MEPFLSCGWGLRIRAYRRTRLTTIEELLTVFPQRSRPGCVVWGPHDKEQGGAGFDASTSALTLSSGEPDKPLNTQNCSIYPIVTLPSMYAAYGVPHMKWHRIIGMSVKRCAFRVTYQYSHNFIIFQCRDSLIGSSTRDGRGQISKCDYFHGSNFDCATSDKVRVARCLVACFTYLLTTRCDMRGRPSTNSPRLIRRLVWPRRKQSACRTPRRGRLKPCRGSLLSRPPSLSSAGRATPSHPRTARAG